jgi:hydroxybutyrate-dimer hydrolase
MFANLSIRLILLVAIVVLVAACQPDAPEPDRAEPGVAVPVELEILSVDHRDEDDLVSAGLGLEGLASAAPTPVSPDSPEADELRRLAFHAAWQGIYSMTPAAGVGGILDELPVVTGREFHAFLTLEGASQPFRVLLQLPDDFDPDDACLVAAPASGSRGVYGAVPLAAPWALPAGCAVVYTDKGAGTDFFDFSTDTGTGLDGRRVARGDAPLGFEPKAADDESTLVGMSHAHSGDHPEADWGLHVLESIRFALEVMDREFDGAIDSSAVRVIAAGVSNGGGAVLRAAESDDEGLIDAVVAIMPNISIDDVAHLFEYAILAAIYQPCLLADMEATMAMPLGNPHLAAAGQLRCGALVRAGLLETTDPDAARAVLEAAGFDEPALDQSTINAALDLWRSVLVTYASAYLARDAFSMPCGYELSAAGATTAQRHAWWATHSGIAPGGGIEIVDSLADGQDRHLPGLLCLQDLIESESDDGEALRSAIEVTRASARLPDIPVLVIHGRDDGLIPVGFSSRPYVDQARGYGADIAYWEVAHAQHFDALLGAPGIPGRYVPLLPYGWAGLDHIMSVLDGAGMLGDDREISPRPAPEGQPLRERDLGL